MYQQCLTSWMRYSTSNSEPRLCAPALYTATRRTIYKNRHQQVLSLQWKSASLTSCTYTYVKSLRQKYSMIIHDIDTCMCTYFMQDFWRQVSIYIGFHAKFRHHSWHQSKPQPTFTGTLSVTHLVSLNSKHSGSTAGYLLFHGIEWFFRRHGTVSTRCHLAFIIFIDSWITM